MLAAGAAIVLWLAFGSPRVESAAAVLLGGGAGLGVAVWAFSRPGLSSDAQPHSVRAHDGAWFAVIFVLAALAVGAFAYLGSLPEERRPLTDARRALVGRIALGVLAAASRSAWSRSSSRPSLRAGSATSPRSRPTRPCRRAAAPGERELVEPLALVEGGVARLARRSRGAVPGAGCFDLVHRLLRTNSIVVTEPHNVPLQFLSRDRLIGLFLALVSIGRRRSVWLRLRGREPAVVALAVLAAAYVLHSLVDFDWDFVAVTAPFLLSVGALLGGPAVRDEPRIAWSPLPAVAAVAVAFSLMTPWFADARPTRLGRRSRTAGRSPPTVTHGMRAR